MERVAFLIEQSGEQVGCLLNPESVLFHRIAGVRPRRSKVGGLIKGGWSDDPLLYTGGGRTELQLDLLFDTSLLPSLRAPREVSGEVAPENSQDIRQVTASIWNLAENTKENGKGRTPPLARFLWGKSWNILGMVTAVSERFERFSQGGVPQRAWMQIRFLRVQETLKPNEAHAQSLQGLTPVGPDTFLSPEQPSRPDTLGKPGTSIQVESGGERLDLLAYRFYGHVSFWRKIALFNNLDNPAVIEAGYTLQLPLLTQEEKKA